MYSSADLELVSRKEYRPTPDVFDMGGIGKNKLNILLILIGSRLVVIMISKYKFDVVMLDSKYQLRGFYISFSATKGAGLDFSRLVESFGYFYGERRE